MSSIIYVGLRDYHSLASSCFNFSLDEVNLIELLYDEDILSPRNLSYITNKTLLEQLEPEKSSQFNWFYDHARISWLNRFKVPFTKIVTKWGLCMNFNMIPADKLLNIDSVSKDLVYNLSSYDSLPKQSSFADPTPWNVLRTGTVLKIVLKQDSTAKYPYYTSSIAFEEFDGVRIIVHNTDEFPTNPKQNYFMPLQSVVDISIDLQVILVDDDFRSMSLSKRNCFFPGEKHLKYFRVYTKANCEQESLSLEIVKACGCAPFYLISKLTKVISLTSSTISHFILRITE